MPVLTRQDDRAVRCLGYVAAEAAVFALLLVLTAQAFLPIHRGTLTPEQYADNVNDMSRFLQLDSDERMEADGTWRDGAPHGGVVIDLWDRAERGPADRLLYRAEAAGGHCAVRRAEEL